MKRLLGIVLIGFLFFGCAQNEVLFFSDPVFLRSMAASDDSLLMESLKKAGYQLHISQQPFDVKAETIEPFLTNDSRKFYAFSPGLTPIYKDLTEIYPGIPLLLVDKIDEEPSSSENAVSLIMSDKAAGPKFLIAGQTDRHGITEALPEADKYDLQIFFWHSAADESVLVEWLKGCTENSSMFFLSTDVPLSILKTVFETVAVSTFYHDLQDTQFLIDMKGRKPGRITFIGKNYNNVLLAALDGILSTQAAENGMKK